MKRRTKLIAAILTMLALAGAATAMVTAGGKNKDVSLPGVDVTRGSLVYKALAVGTIEPRVEISVKSQLSGVVKQQFAEVGDFVRAGTPLIEIQPTPTPQERMDAKRQIQLREIDLENQKKEFARQEALHAKQLISQQEFENIQRGHAEATLQLQMAHERLELLEQGRVAAEANINTIVTAPITGFILNKSIEIGDPVVPLTSYQEGTVLMKMANMDDLIFRGTVDEIDVGRLQEGMEADIKIGALPHAQIEGTLSKIWLKAQKEDNSTVFPLEIALHKMAEPALHDQSEVRAAVPVLRAGYSANAEIIIDRRENVLLIPERLVTFSGDSTYVTVQEADGNSAQRIIHTGLSDAIQIEVVTGLQEGERVLEKPRKEIK